DVRDLNAELIEEITPGLPVEDTAAESAAPVASSATSATAAMLNVAPRDEYMAAFSNVQAPDFGIAPLGDDLQPTPAEKPAPNLELSGISIAPVGSDMGQLPGAAAIVAPDVSHIKLADE